MPFWRTIMFLHLRITLWLVVCSAFVQAAPVPDPRARPKAKVEFRWLESQSVKGLTEEKGIRTTCGQELSYPHRQPVLTNKDVAEASFRNVGSVAGLPGDHYLVSFDLTEQ